MRLPIFDLPLLKKELLELAQQQRTYAGRMVYAILLFTVFCSYFYMFLEQAGSSIDRVLGTGEEMFKFLVRAQMGGIYLFTPPLMAGAIAQEKERDSLHLLFLTEMKPWAIIWQKYLSRLVPMFTFLLLSMPLMAVAYSFGGISPVTLFGGIVSLVTFSAHMGAITLMFSAFASTTLQALLSAYLLSPLVWWCTCGAFSGTLLSFGMRGAAGGIMMTATSIPSLGTTLIFLAVAKHYLVQRAFIPPRSPMLGFLKEVDKFWESFGGRHVVKNRATLPDADPIAWREVSKRALSKSQYIFRLLVVLEVPILLVWLFGYYGGYDRGQRIELSVMLYFLWMIAAFGILLQSVSAISTERMNQTLEVLLTTPLEAREIIQQKLRPIWRLCYVLLVPFLTIFLLEAWTERHSYTYEPGLRNSYDPELHSLLLYLIASFLSVAIYLPLLGWFGMWIGLRIKNRARALMLAIVIVVIWCTGPYLLQQWLPSANQIKSSMDMSFWKNFSGLIMEYLPYLSPVKIISVAESSMFNAFIGLNDIAINFLSYLAIVILFRDLCLRRADKLLGRT